METQSMPAAFRRTTIPVIMFVCLIFSSPALAFTPTPNEQKIQAYWDGFNADYNELPISKNPNKQLDETYLKATLAHAYSHEKFLSEHPDEIIKLYRIEGQTAEDSELYTKLEVALKEYFAADKECTEAEIQYLKFFIKNRQSITSSETQFHIDDEKIGDEYIKVRDTFGSSTRELNQKHEALSKYIVI